MMNSDIKEHDEQVVSCKTCNDTGHINISCCGQPVIGATYMDQVEYICCNEPDSDPCPDCELGSNQQPNQMR